MGIDATEDAGAHLGYMHRRSQDGVESQTDMLAGPNKSLDMAIWTLMMLKLLAWTCRICTHAEATRQP